MKYVILLYILYVCMYLSCEVCDIIVYTVCMYVLKL